MSTERGACLQVYDTDGSALALLGYGKVLLIGRDGERGDALRLSRRRDEALRLGLHVRNDHMVACWIDNHVVVHPVHIAQDLC